MLCVPGAVWKKIVLLSPPPHILHGGGVLKIKIMKKVLHCYYSLAIDYLGLSITQRKHKININKKEVKDLKLLT
jgi:hypothetical protein